MSELNGKTRWPDSIYFQNLKRFPLDELEKYAGKYVAWSEDGTRIVDSCEDDAVLYSRLKSAGFDMSRTLIDFVEVR